MVKGDKLSGDGRTIMAVSCCPMQHILKCKMETRNLFFFYLFVCYLRGRFLCRLPLCPDASNRLLRLTRLIRKHITNRKIKFELHHRLVSAVQSKSWHCTCCFNFMDLWMVSGLCAAVPPKLWLLLTVCPTHNGG